MKLNKIIVLALAASSLVACSDSMNYYEFNVEDEEYVKRDFKSVGALITACYNYLDYDFGQNYSGAMLASATDESEYAIKGNDIEKFTNGAWNSTVNPMSSVWTNSYKGIEACNLYLDRFTGLTFDELKTSSDYESQMKHYNNYQYEARWCRAYYYFNLVRQYGGVPLILSSKATASEVNSLPRKTSDEIFQFIFDECDDIEGKILPDNTKMTVTATPETGRVDSVTVLALKARAALYWASPLFNPDGDKERYHKAALWTKKLLDACDKRGFTLAKKYANLWAKDNYAASSSNDAAKEMIFTRRVSETYNDIEKYNYPVGIAGAGKGGNCPTQDLVDAYEMKNGKAIDEDGSGYSEANMYKNRDPRLALTIAKNGDLLWPSKNMSKLETFYGGLNAEPLLGGTPTSYYLKKYLHSSIDLASNSKYSSDTHTWITFRLGEFYLNYAEALFKWLGSGTATDSEFTMSADEAINKVRKRAGMPNFPTTLTAVQWWKKYTNERRVELAFEGHRFWDVRRWKEADKYFKSITELKITKGDDGKFTYTRQKVDRVWNDKMYLFPIPNSERMKNPNLTQNPGWE